MSQRAPEELAKGQSPSPRCLALMSLQQDQLCRHPVRGKAAVGMELGMRGDPVLQDSGHSSASLCQASSHLHGINAVVATAYLATGITVAMQALLGLRNCPDLDGLLGENPVKSSQVACSSLALWFTWF